MFYNYIYNKTLPTTNKKFIMNFIIIKKYLLIVSQNLICCKNTVNDYFIAKNTYVYQ